MDHKKPKTNIVWSYKSQDLDQRAKEAFLNRECSCLRLIYSPRHADKLIDFLKAIHTKDQDHTAIMLDISYQKQGLIYLEKESRTLNHDERLFVGPKGSNQPIQIECASFEELFRKGTTGYFGMSEVVFKVEAVKKDSAELVILQGGELVSGAYVNVPETRKHTSIFELNTIDTKLFSGLEPDFLVLPGDLSSRELMIIIKKIHQITKNLPWLILRIDNLRAKEESQKNLSLVNGLLITRKELSLSVEPASVPVICKELIHEVHSQGKMIFMASEILSSMREFPTPTRAEVSDIANAAIDGADAVVLSDEVIRGPHLLRAQKVCTETILDAEANLQSSFNWQKSQTKIKNELQAITYQANLTGKRVKAKAIVCLTKHGNTARELASLGASVPIVAFTFSKAITRKLNLLRGASAYALEGNPNLDQVLPMINELLKDKLGLKTGDTFIFVTISLSPVGYEASNLFTVQNIL